MTFFYWGRYVFLLALVAAVVLFAWWSVDNDVV
jgi:hypothetical protein